MGIILDRVNDAVHFVAKNDANNEVHIDGSPKIGGEELGVRPMELVLMAVGSCSSMDVLSILKKMKQEVTTYRVEVNGEREPDAVPAVFTGIHIKFIVGGNVEESKLKKAINLSMEKYCSVSIMLKSSVNITTSFEVVRSS